MRILIINPNSSGEMTRAIQAAAEEFAEGSGTIEVQTVATPGAPAFIETYEDQLAAAPGMIELIRDNEAAYDAFVVACHCDPNLDALKEICRKPVVGIGEASMKIASMISDRFSVVSATSQSIPNKEALVRKYHLERALASVRAPDHAETPACDEDRYMAAAEAAVRDDMAEVIVLGCAGMAGLDARMQKQLGVPVLDGVVCALMIASGLAAYGVSTSKVRRYRGDLREDARGDG